MDPALSLWASGASVPTTTDLSLGDLEVTAWGEGEPVPALLVLALGTIVRCDMDRTGSAASVHRALDGGLVADTISSAPSIGDDGALAREILHGSQPMDAALSAIITLLDRTPRLGAVCISAGLLPLLLRSLSADSPRHGERTADAISAVARSDTLCRAAVAASGLTMSLISLAGSGGEPDRLAAMGALATISGSSRAATDPELGVPRLDASTSAWGATRHWLVSAVEAQCVKALFSAEGVTLMSSTLCGAGTHPRARQAALAMLRAVSRNMCSCPTSALEEAILSMIAHVTRYADVASDRVCAWEALLASMSGPRAGHRLRNWCGLVSYSMGDHESLSKEERPLAARALAVYARLVASASDESEDLPTYYLLSSGRLTPWLVSMLDSEERADRHAAAQAIAGIRSLGWHGMSSLSDCIPRLLHLAEFPGDDEVLSAVVDALVAVSASPELYHLVSTPSALRVLVPLVDGPIAGVANAVGSLIGFIVADSLERSTAVIDAGAVPLLRRAAARGCGGAAYALGLLRFAQ